MHNVNKALADITDIRNQMAAGRMFRGFAPAVIALTGLFAALLMAAQLLWPDALARDAMALLGWWVLAACMSVIFIGFEMLSLSRRYHGGLADSMVMQVIQTFFPVGAIGAAIGFIILKNAPDLAWLLPGLWQLLIAMGTFSALKFLPKRVFIAGLWYFLAGSTVLFLGSLSQTLTPWAMGISFAFGQWIMAFILYKTLKDSA